MDKLVGTWTGQQRYGSRAAEVTVEFKGEPKLRAHYTVVAPGEGTFTWIANVEVDGSSVVATYPGEAARVDTLTLAGATLKGSYTFKGKPWGTLELKKKT